MPLPPWALFAIAAWLLLFGSFRIIVALRGRRRSGEDQSGEDQAGRGILALSWRRHLVFGVFYLLVGLYLVVMGFGYGVPTALAPSEPIPLPAERSEQLVID